MKKIHIYDLILILFIVLILSHSDQSKAATVANPSLCDPNQPTCDIAGVSPGGAASTFGLDHSKSYTIDFSNNTTLKNANSYVSDGNNIINIVAGTLKFTQNYALNLGNGNNTFNITNNSFMTLALNTHLNFGNGSNIMNLGDSASISEAGNITFGSDNTGNITLNLNGGTNGSNIQTTTLNFNEATSNINLGANSYIATNTISYNSGNNNINFTQNGSLFGLMSADDTDPANIVTVNLYNNSILTFNILDNVTGILVSSNIIMSPTSTFNINLAPSSGATFNQAIDALGTFNVNLGSSSTATFVSDIAIHNNFGLSLGTGSTLTLASLSSNNNDYTTSNVNISNNATLALQSRELYLNGTNNTLSLGSGAAINLTASSNYSVNMGTSDTAENNITFADNSEITNTTNPTTILNLQGNNNITIGNNVVLGNGTETSILANGAGTTTLTMTGDTHTNYVFNFSSNSQVNMFIDARNSNFGSDASNHITLSENGVNNINFLTSANSLNFDVSNLTLGNNTTNLNVSGGGLATLISTHSLEFDGQNDSIVVTNSSLAFNQDMSFINGNNIFTLDNSSFTGHNLLFSGQNNTVNVYNGKLTLTGNINFLSGNNTLNITDGSLISSNLIFSGSSNTVNINSYNTAVTIDGSLNFVDNNGTLNINTNVDNIPQDVTITGAVSGVSNIDLGLSDVKIGGYTQNNDLSLVIGVTVQNDVLKNGILTFNNNANFNNQKVGLNLSGAYNISNSSITTPFTMTIMNTSGNGSITGIDTNTVSINSLIFSVASVNNNGKQVDLTINECSITSVLQGKICKNAISTGGSTNPNSGTNNSNNTITYTDKNIIAISNYIDNLSQDEVIMANSSTLDTIFDRLTNFVGSNTGLEHLEQYIATLQPVNNEVLLSYDNTTINNFKQGVFSPHSLNSKGFVRTWIMSEYNNTLVDNDGVISGSRIQSANFFGGIEADAFTNQILGLTYGYSNSHIKSSNDASDSSIYKGDLQTFDVGIYHKIKLTTNSYLKSLGFYSLGAFDLSRTIYSVGNSDQDTFSEEAKAKPNMNVIGVDTKYFYTIPQNDKALPTATTYVGGAYNSYFMKGYNESGFEALHVKGSSSSLIEAKAGIIVNKVFTFKSSQSLIPTADLEVDFNKLYMKNTMASLIDDGNSGMSFTNYNPNYFRLYINPTLKLDYLVGKRFSSKIFVNAKLSQSIKGYTVGAELKYAL